MKHVTDFPREIVEQADMAIVMPDGCRLSARVWMPKDALQHPVPVILEHLPYRKRDGTVYRDEINHPWFAGHGYCCIRTDMRGNGESDGLMDDEYTAQELQDALNVIAWAASQPWCNGKVGMMGISWGGFNCLQVAALRPPALKAVVSVCSTVDRYADDIHYKGGCLLLENFGWAANMLSYSSRPPDRALVGDKWKAMWLNRLDNQPWHWSQWLGHQHRDDYWKHGSICEDFSAIEAAVLSMGGWHDGYRNTISHLVENIKAPVKGIVGPGNHKYAHIAGPKPAFGFLQEAKRWWDRWLKDQNTGVENDADYRAWLMQSLAPKRWFDERPGRWIAEQQWPSANIAMETWHLGHNTLASSPQEVKLTVNSAMDCGTASGEYFPFAYSDELPDEQSGDDDRSLCFDGPVLDEATDIVGAAIVSLKVTADRPDALLAVRLCDLRPDGTSALITAGFLNLTHRASHENPQPVVSGQEMEISFALDQIAYHIPAGHRLRVAVSTACWPFIWPSPERAELTLMAGRIDIPSRPLAEGDDWRFEEAEGAKGWDATSLRPSSYSRETATDAQSGVVTTKIHSDNGKNRDNIHGLISGSWFREEFSIHPDDPLSAKVSAEWEQGGGREGAMWRTHVEAEMSSTLTHFKSAARLRAYDNEELVFDRLFEDAVPRQMV